MLMTPTASVAKYDIDISQTGCVAMPAADLHDREAVCSE